MGTFTINISITNSISCYNYFETAFFETFKKRQASDLTMKNVISRQLISRQTKHQVP